MTSFDSKVLPGSQKMRTHVAMVFAWNELTDIFLYCGSVINSVTVVTAMRYRHVTMVQSDNLSRKQSCRVATSIERNIMFLPQ